MLKKLHNNYEHIFIGDSENGYSLSLIGSQDKQEVKKFTDDFENYCTKTGITNATYTQFLGVLLFAVHFDADMLKTSDEKTYFCESINYDKKDMNKVIMRFIPLRENIYVQIEIT